MTVGKMCGQPCNTGVHDIAISRQSGFTAALHGGGKSRTNTFDFQLQSSGGKQ